MSDESQIQPALTPEEWVVWLRHYDPASRIISGHTEDGGDLSQHALAALCLYSTPGGFTWEDVDDCRERAEDLRTQAKDTPSKSHDVQHGLFLAAQRWDRRADRIAALLPPREKVSR